MRSRNVGELPGILVVLFVPESDGAAMAAVGSGLTCSAVTSRRLSEVPSGVHVISVSIGLVVLYTSLLTWVGCTTSVFVTV